MQPMPMGYPVAYGMQPGVMPVQYMQPNPVVILQQMQGSAVTVCTNKTFVEKMKTSYGVFRLLLLVSLNSIYNNLIMK